MPPAGRRCVVGRIATAVIVVMGICWVLVIKSLHSDLYVYLQSVQGYLSPAIAVLFLLGVFWKRATAPAALWAFVVGVDRRLCAPGRRSRHARRRRRGHDSQAAALPHTPLRCDQYNAAHRARSRPRHGWVFDFWNIHWLYYTQILLVVTAVLMIVISLLTQAARSGCGEIHLVRGDPEEKAATRASWNASDVVLSLIVLAAVCGVLRRVLVVPPAAAGLADSLGRVPGGIMRRLGRGRGGPGHRRGARGGLA